MSTDKDKVTLYSCALHFVEDMDALSQTRGTQLRHLGSYASGEGKTHLVNQPRRRCDPLKR